MSLRAHNDILKAVDDNKSLILLLLDLSAKVDTILVSRLVNRFGITYLFIYLASPVSAGISQQRQPITAVPALGTLLLTGFVSIFSHVLLNSIICLAFRGNFRHSSFIALFALKQLTFESCEDNIRHLPLLVGTI